MPTLCANWPRHDTAERLYRGYRLFARRRDEGTGLYRRTWLLASVTGGGPVLFDQGGVWDGDLDELLTQMTGLVDLCIEQGVVMR